MKNKIFIIMLVFLSSMENMQAQITEPPTHAQSDSIIMKTTIFFSRGHGKYIEKGSYKAIGRLLNWAQADSQTPIVITGWTDESGTQTANERLSLHRARAVRNYLVQKGIAPERISFKGCGVDREATSSDKARRADVQGIVRRTMNTLPSPEVSQVVVCEQKPKEARQEAVAEEAPATVPDKEQVVAEPAPQRWYAGVEAGVLTGVSTFTSFTSNGKAGFEAGVLGGYRISPLLSAELEISFGWMKLGASQCCRDYFLGADGVRYLEHVTGLDSYSYKDVRSSVFVQQYALRLNVDMLQIVNPDWNKRWSLSLSPTLYGIGTRATLKEAGSNHQIIRRDGQFQFGAGAGIGGGYQISPRLGIGLHTEAVWVFGKRYDGIAPTDHKENLIWNNTVTMTWRFGK